MLITSCVLPFSGVNISLAAIISTPVTKATAIRTWADKSPVVSILWIRQEMTRLLEINPGELLFFLTSRASLPLFIEEHWSNVDYCEVYTNVNTCNDESQYATRAMTVLIHFEVHISDVTWKHFHVEKYECVTWILDLLFICKSNFSFYADCNNAK